MNSPCYKCPKRSITCHSNCKDYDDWALEGNKKKNKIRETKENKEIYLGYKVEAIERVKGKRGQY